MTILMTACLGCPRHALVARLRLPECRWRARHLCQLWAALGQAFCSAEGKSWPQRADGMCYLEDLPK